MVVSFIVALYFQFLHPLTGLPIISTGLQLITGVAVTTIAWIGITYLTPPVDKVTLRRFYSLVRPGGPGWKSVVQHAAEESDPIEPTVPVKWSVPAGILAMVLGCIFIFSLLFATGNWIYSNHLLGGILTLVSALSGYVLFRLTWRKIA